MGLKISAFIFFVLAIVAAFAAEMNGHHDEPSPSPSPSPSSIVISSPLPFEKQFHAQQPGIASSPGGVTGVYNLPDPAGLGS